MRLFRQSGSGGHPRIRSLRPSRGFAHAKRLTPEHLARSLPPSTFTLLPVHSQPHASSSYNSISNSIAYAYAYAYAQSRCHSGMKPVL